MVDAGVDAVEGDCILDLQSVDFVSGRGIRLAGDLEGNGLAQVAAVDHPAILLINQRDGNLLRTNQFVGNIVMICLELIHVSGAEHSHLDQSAVTAALDAAYFIVAIGQFVGSGSMDVAGDRNVAKKSGNIVILRLVRGVALDLKLDLGILVGQAPAAVLVQQGDRLAFSVVQSVGAKVIVVLVNIGFSSNGNFNGESLVVCIVAQAGLIHGDGGVVNIVGLAVVLVAGDRNILQQAGHGGVVRRFRSNALGQEADGCLLLIGYDPLVVDVGQKDVLRALADDLVFASHLGDVRICRNGDSALVVFLSHRGSGDNVAAIQQFGKFLAVVGVVLAGDPNVQQRVQRGNFRFRRRSRRSRVAGQRNRRSRNSFIQSPSAVLPLQFDCDIRHAIFNLILVLAIGGVCGFVGIDIRFGAIDSNGRRGRTLGIIDFIAFIFRFTLIKQVGEQLFMAGIIDTDNFDCIFQQAIQLFIRRLMGIFARLVNFLPLRVENQIRYFIIFIDSISSIWCATTILRSIPPLELITFALEHVVQDHCASGVVIILDVSVRSTLVIRIISNLFIRVSIRVFNKAAICHKQNNLCAVKTGSTIPQPHRFRESNSAIL